MRRHRLFRSSALTLKPFLFWGITCILLVLLFRGGVLIFSFARETGMTPGTLAGLLFDTGADLEPIDDRVNVAVLGIAGGDHAGADLTDTILVFSFNTVTHTLGMVSVPRDLWSDTLKDKVNSAYHYGEEKKKGGGLVLAKAIISDMVGIPIQYGIMFDFTKFQSIIDLVGGVTIDVPRAFTDTEYPVAGKENDECGGDPTYACRYEALHFDAGEQTMDGKRALSYVRTRHAEGEEGSDFARSRRQQQVIIALKEAFVSRAVIRHPNTLISLYHAFDNATDTDMNIAQLLTIGKLFVRLPQSSVTRVSIESLLYAPPESWYGRYVLIPEDSFDAIHDYVSRQLK